MLDTTYIEHFSIFELILLNIVKIVFLFLERVGFLAFKHKNLKKMQKFSNLSLQSKFLMLY